jgi:hypothetical protein
VPILLGLPGFAERVPAISAQSVRAVFRILRDGTGGATSAGNYGAFTVWRDDAGKYRCEADRFKQAVDTQTFTTLKQVAAWTKNALLFIEGKYEFSEGK